MKSFSFRLQRVLDWRALQLAIEEAALKRLMDEQQLLESQVESVRKAIDESEARVARLDDIRGIDLARMGANREFLKNELARLRQQLIEKKRLTREQVEKHRNARQRYKLLDELRTRQHSEWKIDIAKEWDNLAHDSYLARWKSV